MSWVKERLKKFLSGEINHIHCVKCVRIPSYSGPYFPAFGLNTERYGLPLRIQCECGKIWTRITPNMDTFHAVISGNFVLSSLRFEVQELSYVTWLCACLFRKHGLVLVNAFYIAFLISWVMLWFSIAQLALSLFTIVNIPIVIIETPDWIFLNCCNIIILISIMSFFTR